MTVDGHRTRTPEQAMAFTSGEFWRGAWTAWGLFMILLLACLIVVSIATGAGFLLVIVLMYGALVGGSISLLAMLAFSPLAWLIGRWLRKLAVRWVHAVVFTLFGAGVGAAMPLICQLVLGTPTSYPLDAWTLTLIGASATAVGGGWWCAVRRALDSDSPAPHRAIQPGVFGSRRDDPDSAFEDRALDG